MIAGDVRIGCGFLLLVLVAGVLNFNSWLVCIVQWAKDGETKGPPSLVLVVRLRALAARVRGAYV